MRKEWKTEVGDGEERGTTLKQALLSIAGMLIRDFARDAMRLIVAFLIATGASAMVCLYFGLPLVLSLLGGFMVLAIAVFFISTDLRT